VAGLEAALALRELAEERVHIDLLAPEPFYWYRPLAVAEPFGVGVMQRVELVEVAAAARAEFTLGSLGEVDSTRRRARTEAGAEFSYDALVVACGARPRPAVPGALTFRGPADVNELRGLLAAAEAGAVENLLFAVPGGIVWPLPLYELALLTAAYLGAHVAGRVELGLVTPEERPLQVFGVDASQAVNEVLAEREIGFHGGQEPVAFEHGTLATAAGLELAAGQVVALPRLGGAAIEGLPHDADGFLPVDRYGRVVGLEGVYAAGDITNFPAKQGGLAAQQAHAVAETIAEEAGAPVQPRPFRPVLRGLLLTGGIPRYLRTPLGRSGSEAQASVEPLWWPPAKIAARRLGAFLAGRALEPTGEGTIPVEVDFGTTIDDENVTLGEQGRADEPET